MNAQVYHKSRGYCLVDPKGNGVHYGTAHRCLAAYYEKRFKRPWLSDVDVENAKVALKASKWEIKRVFLTIAEAA